MLDQPVVEARQLVRIEFRRRPAEMAEIEMLHQNVQRQIRLDRLRGAEMGEQAVDRHRLDAVLAEAGDGEAAEPLRQALAGRIRDQRRVSEARHRGAQRLKQLDLDRGVGDVVLAPDDVGDRQVDVVDHSGQRVDRPAVGPEEDRIGEVGRLEVHVASDLVVPVDAARLQHEAPMRHDGLREILLFRIRQAQRGAVIDRRLAGVDLRLPLQRQLLRRLEAGIEAA